MINCNDMLVLENNFGRKLYTQKVFERPNDLAISS